MNNILVTRITDYTECHGVMSSRVVSEICRLSGYRGVAFAGKKQYLDRSTPWLTVHHLPSALQSQQKIDLVDEALGPEPIDVLFSFLEWWVWDHLVQARARTRKSVAWPRCYIAGCLDHARRLPAHYLDTLMQELGRNIGNEQRMLRECDHIVVAGESVIADIRRLNPECGQDHTIVPLYSSKIPLLSQEPMLDDYAVDQCFFIGKMDAQDGHWRLRSTQGIIGIGDRIYNADQNQPRQFQQDWYRAVGSAPFGILPAPYETRGMIVQEIQALGRIPVVDPHSSGTAAQLQHGVDGFYCDFDGDWRSQIQQFISEHGDHGLKLIAERARSRILGSYVPAPAAISNALIGLANG